MYRFCVEQLLCVENYYDTSRAYREVGEIGNGYKILIRNFEGKRPHGREA
jgi:hypothetical protein